MPDRQKELLNRIVAAHKAITDTEKDKQTPVESVPESTPDNPQPKALPRLIPLALSRPDDTQ